MKTITISEHNGQHYISIRGIRGQQSCERQALNMKTKKWENGNIAGKNNPCSHKHHHAVNTKAIVTIGGVKRGDYLPTAHLGLKMGVTGYTTRRMLLDGRKHNILPPINCAIRTTRRTKVI